MWSFVVGSRTFSGSVTFMNVRPSTAVVDTAASEALIGVQAFEELKRELEKKGVAPATRKFEGAPPLGIGGAAKVLFGALVLVLIARKAGLIRLTVVDAEVPPLLPIGLLDELGANIDLTTNTMERYSWNDGFSTMERPPSGRRTIEIVPADGTFGVSKKAAADFGLKREVFRPHAQSSGRNNQASVPSVGESRQGPDLCTTRRKSTARQGWATQPPDQWRSGRG